MQPAEFIETLHRHFGKRHNSPEDQAFWLKEMISVVQGTDKKVLRKAYELIRDSHEERAFPLPATLKRFITQAGEIVYPERHGSAERDAVADWMTRTGNAERLMMQTELGQQAARDGWANGMREFICAHGRLPHEHEIGRLIENAIFIDRCATGEMDLGIAHKGLVKLAQKLIDRRDAIADRVQNGIAR